MLALAMWALRRDQQTTSRASPVWSGASENQRLACRVFADAIFAVASFARSSMNGC
jgi:hypothetical protein